MARPVVWLPDKTAAAVLSGLSLSLCGVGREGWKSTDSDYYVTAVINLSLSSELEKVPPVEALPSHVHNLLETSWLISSLERKNQQQQQQNQTRQKHHIILYLTCLHFR